MNKKDLEKIYKEGLLTEKEFEQLRKEIVFKGEILNFSITLLELFSVFLSTIGHLIPKNK